MGILDTALREQARVNDIAAKLASPNAEQTDNNEEGHHTASGGDSPRETVERLAALSRLEYDRARQHEAEALGVRVNTLDQEVAKTRKALAPENGDSKGQGRDVVIADDEPWSDPVNGAMLLKEIAGIIRRYVVLPANAVLVLALWILHTFCFDIAEATPYLYLHSATKRCGKSRLLELLARMARRALVVAGPSAAFMFRVIELYKPALFMDEADAFLRDDEDMRGLLNNGYKQGGSVGRLVKVGDELVPKQFSVFCPKVLAGIKGLSGTVMDRSIPIPMKRRTKDEKIETMRLRKLGEQMKPLRQQCERWASDNMSALENASPDIPESLNDRAAEVCEPLLAIAEAVGGEWPKKARDALVELLGAEDDDVESMGVMLLADMRDLFVKHGDRLLSATIAEELAKLEERPWPEYRNGRPITVRQIAALLRHFDIKPITLRVTGDLGKGYTLDAFADAFARYLSETGVNDPLHRSNVDVARVSAGSRSVTSESSVTDEKPLEPATHMDCYGVTDREGGIEEVVAKKELRI